MPFRRGDVVLASIEFSNRTGTKWRPAVVVSSDAYNAESPDVVVASITGNRRAIAHPGDREIVEWQRAGLLRPSLAQTKLTTVEASAVGRRLGRLQPADLDAFDDGLRAALAL